MPGKKYKWTVAEEDLLIDRYEAARFMYDMSDKEYMNAPKKTTFLNDLSKELKIPVAQIEKRWRSFRTNHGREMNGGKSGSGAKPKSKRKEALNRRLAFINRHIKRRKTRSSLPDDDDVSEEEADADNASHTGSGDEQEPTEEEGREEVHEHQIKNLHTPESSVLEEEEDEVVNEKESDAMSSGDNSEEVTVNESENKIEAVRSDEDEASDDDDNVVEEPSDSVVAEEEDISAVESSQHSDKSEGVENIQIEPKPSTSNGTEEPAKSHEERTEGSEAKAQKPEKRKLEVWEEDLLPVNKAPKVNKEKIIEKTNNHATLKDRKDGKVSEDKAGTSKNDESKELRPPTPPPPPPKTDTPPDPNKSKEKNVKVKNAAKLDGGVKAGQKKDGGEKGSQHKPSAAKTKKALKTLKDFKALVGDDDVEDASPAAKPKGIIRKPPPPLDESGAKKDKGGGKSTKKSQVKAAVPPKRLETQIAKAAKAEPKKKENNDERLDNLEREADRRFNVIEKMAESWSGFGKKLGQSSSQGTVDSASVVKQTAGSDFTDEERFWSGLLITRLRRIKDRQVKDDVMLRCEQIINDAIRDKKKKDIAVGVDAGATTAVGTGVVSAASQNVKISQTPPVTATSNTHSETHTGGSAATSMSALLTTPPRVHTQYTAMNNVPSGNIPQNVQNQLSCSSNMMANQYGHGMAANTQSWIPGSPSLPQAPVYCHNYYGVYPNTQNQDGQGGHM